MHKPPLSKYINPVEIRTDFEIRIDIRLEHSFADRPCNFSTIALLFAQPTRLTNKTLRTPFALFGKKLLPTAANFPFTYPHAYLPSTNINGYISRLI